jgi:hypothetical protein
MTSVCVRVCMCAIIAILIMQSLSDDAADELVQLLVGGILYPWLRGLYAVIPNTLADLKAAQAGRARSNFVCSSSCGDLQQ